MLKKPASGKTKVSRPDPVAVVAEQYLNAGWTVLRGSAGSTQHLITQKNSGSGKAKLHFVKVIAGNLPTGGELSVFVQNAVSNGAQPVYAVVSIKENKGANGAPSTFVSKVSYEDKNTASAIILRQKKTTKGGSDESQAEPKNGSDKADA